MKNDKKLARFGLLVAIVASLCCITGILTMIIGSSIFISFKWLIPFKPFLVSLSILILFMTWYPKIKKTNKCHYIINKDTPKNNPISNKWLTIWSIVIMLILSLPLILEFNGIPNESHNHFISFKKITQFELDIKHMEGFRCEYDISEAVCMIHGVLKAQVSYTDSNAIIEFDSKKTTIDGIINTIDNLGYQATIKNDK